MDDIQATRMKKDKYEEVICQTAAVLAGENNNLVKMTTVTAMLANAFPETFFWTGFYCVDPDKKDELHVGPYQGTLGCLRIAFGKGVCGTAAETGETQIVENVHTIENHIACDSLTNSEIVVPVWGKDGSLFAVLDIDSTSFSAFDSMDAKCLEKLLKTIFS